MLRRSIVVPVLVLLAALSRPVAAEDNGRQGLQSFGLRSAFGQTDRSGITMASLLPRLTLFFPAAIDRPLADRHWQAEMVFEPIVSYINADTEMVEAGANLLFVSLSYDRGQRLVPFLEGGEGLLYTDLTGGGLGTHFQFSSQVGGGAHWFLDRTTALTLSYRMRHISNAGISRENSGLNTDFFSIGLSIFPKR
ncbi:MAG: acyloxyacyl hydrolase [Deltaproteobacteria bacterium]|nr:acyloxyacyl hydrolase [Deltaproteobacteria bacterium]